jgi:hypothetical protein
MLAMTDYAYGAFKRENPEWEQDFEDVEKMYFDTLDKWQTSNEKQYLEELGKLKDNGDMETYTAKAKNLISKLKKDYKRQTQN